jgi:putative chitinase
MRDEAAFYNSLRGGLLGPTIDVNELQGCKAILDAMQGCPLSHIAYAFATAYHETNATLQPVREAYWLSERYRKLNFAYYPYYGRGYVQLTWRANYVKADNKLGLKGALIRDLDLALRPDIAAKVMRIGMIEGWFAGDKQGRHTLKRHLPDAVGTLAQFVSARRIINGVDDNLLIARHSMQFQNALTAGGR